MSRASRPTRADLISRPFSKSFTLAARAYTSTCVSPSCPSTTNFRPHWSSSRRTANVHGQDRPAPRRSQSVSDRMRPECMKPPPKGLPVRSNRRACIQPDPSKFLAYSAYSCEPIPTSRDIHTGPYEITDQPRIVLRQIPESPHPAEGFRADDHAIRHLFRSCSYRRMP